MSTFPTYYFLITCLWFCFALTLPFKLALQSKSSFFFFFFKCCNVVILFCYLLLNLDEIFFEILFVNHLDEISYFMEVFQNKYNNVCN